MDGRVVIDGDSCAPSTANDCTVSLSDAKEDYRMEMDDGGGVSLQFMGFVDSDSPPSSGQVPASLSLVGSDSDYSAEVAEVNNVPQPGVKRRRKPGAGRKSDKKKKTGEACSQIEAGEGKEESIPDLAQKEKKKEEAVRARGRPIIHGRYSGLGWAREAAKAARFAALRVKEERQWVTIKEPAKAAAHKSPPKRSPPPDPQSMVAADISAQFETVAQSIRSVVLQSKGLKGTNQKVLNDAVALMRELASALLARSSSEETQKLARELETVREENKKLRLQLDELRQQCRQLVPPEQTQKAIEGQMLRQRLTGRNHAPNFNEVVAGTSSQKTAGPSQTPAKVPAKQKASTQAPTRGISKPETTPTAPVVVQAVEQAGKSAAKRKRRRKKKKGGSEVPQNVAPTSTKNIRRGLGNGTRVAAPSQQQSGGQWSTVGQKKADKKAARNQRKAAKKSAAKLKAPRSAAVVITLQPEAEGKGVKYADVLAKAKAAIKLDELDISAVRFKTTRTGARMLEIPGATSGPKADALAERLKASLPDDVVRVSRPMKTIELRVSGLDDSVSQAELATAVAAAGGCPVEHVRSGIIRAAPSGLGTAVVSCPVTAAKKLAGGKRLLVGWVSAQVKLMEPRPVRCYRCMANGHVGVRCTAEVTCIGRCFRCGQLGHKAAGCSAAPHCVACAAAGKPADHRMGSKTCAPPKNKGKSKVTAAPIQRSQPSASIETSPVEMEVVEVAQQ